ncbi:STE3-domain-containing protein [Peniophora sp. CONT]|nr:STE3-domain-containing protein [Peniophora sp. CONT]
MVAADPTYPLYPVANILSAAMLLLVLLTSFIRQKWNLGIVFLCFWLFLDTLTVAIDATIWSDNADIKLLIYCDIVSRLQLVCYVVKPMATLIISRRLYLIASLRSLELPGTAAVRREAQLPREGIAFASLILTCLSDYIVQGARFQVEEGFGCTNAVHYSILAVLLVQVWSVAPPLLSVLVYYPRVARIFYRQHRVLNRFLQSNDSISRTNYLRILALASIDVLLTLPMGIVSLVLFILPPLHRGPLPFYQGWVRVHSDWGPESISYADLTAGGAANLAELYFQRWSSPVLVFAIFGLFGMTMEARTSYRRILRSVTVWSGLGTQTDERGVHSSLSAINFAAHPQETVDVELGYTLLLVYIVPCLICHVRSRLRLGHNQDTSKNKCEEAARTPSSSNLEATRYATMNALPSTSHFIPRDAEYLNSSVAEVCGGLRDSEL